MLQAALLTCVQQSHDKLHDGIDRYHESKVCNKTHRGVDDGKDQGSRAQVEQRRTPKLVEHQSAYEGAQREGETAQEVDESKVFDGWPGQVGQLNQRWSLQGPGHSLVTKIKNIE